MSEKNGGPAFPVAGMEDGMYLRDYFAAKAMQAHLSSREIIEGVAYAAQKLGIDVDDCIARAAYEYADAMLRAREVVKP